ncbi:MAG: hypothetical protein U0790_11190 [Isosphaeraceae bacterium]
MARRALLAGLLALTVSPSARAQIHGPTQLPVQLPGLWIVSLCVSDTHAWIRYQHTVTGEIHTCGRYGRGFGSITDSSTGKRLWPAAVSSGVQWDMDIQYDRGLRRDMRVLRSTLIRNPIIYRGTLNGFGHLGVRINCVTYARDAWYFYTREYFPLPVIASPRALAARAEKGPPPGRAE